MASAVSGSSTNNSRYGKYFESVNKILQEMQIDTARYKIDFNHWIRFNQLRDQGVPIPDIRQMTEIHEVTALITLEYVRLCIMKYNGDEDKVRKCLQGMRE
jgi:hypothetical protein